MGERVEKQERVASKMKRFVGPLSHRRMQSLLKAEAVAQELRYQLSAASCKKELDTDALVGLIVKWMRVTGKQKYERPNATNEPPRIGKDSK